MSKEQEHIDKLIKAKLADRSFGAPPEAFINDINKKLDKNYPKPFKFYLFSILASLMFGIFLVLLLIPSEFKIPVQVEGNLASKTENTLKIINDVEKSGTVKNFVFLKT